jgi:beta-N-acetylhexosaminidase
MMTAHVLFELFDPTRAATLSSAIVTGLLRTELDFRGLIFSDDLHMKAVCETYGVPEAACLAIAAGCDQVLVCQSEADVFSAHEALIKRAENDASFAARLHVAAEHSRQCRSRYPALASDAARIEQQVATSDAAPALEERIQTALAMTRARVRIV